MGDYGFAPTVRCPHCGHVLRPQMTGWARTGINSRFKDCKVCKQEFYVVAYVYTSKKSPRDNDIRQIEDSIRRLNRVIKERIDKLDEQLVIVRSAWRGAKV